MSYPPITEYQDAVQDPRNTFSDPELKVGRVALSPLGLPMPMSGGFVLTYKIQSGNKKFAVRCFHREVPQVQVRYSQISAKLRSLASNYFVHFDFQAGGIRVHGKSYPVVKMDWVEGDTLGVHLDKASLKPPDFSTLRQGFATLAEYLERNVISHGDIQNENVMVSGGSLRLIDYDGMFVAGMTPGQGSEVGHKHFQHPGRTVRLFGPTMDRFSFIVLDVSLEAVAADASLHRRFREGGQAIIFKANDFTDPSSSEVFRILRGMPTVRESAKKLAAICVAPATEVPTLSDFRAGRNIPIPAASPVGAPPRPAPAHVYIGAFAVIDGKDFNAVLRRVGDKIELVGQIVSVRQRTTRRNGRPYVFINFGTGQHSVKVTIWSEGLEAMRTPPTQAWVGRWISVTGLVELYERQYYGRPYRNLGVTLTSNNQIIQISEQEAKFRLGRAQRPALRNDEILVDLRGNTEPNVRGGTTTTPPPTLPNTPTAKNEQILRNLQMSGAQTPSTSYSPVPAPARMGQRSKWFWPIAVAAAAGAALYFFAGPQTPKSSYQPSPNTPTYQPSRRPPSVRTETLSPSTRSPAQAPTAPPQSNASTDSLSDHGPGRVACDARWSELHRPDSGYQDFIRDCMKRPQ